MGWDATPHTGTRRVRAAARVTVGSERGERPEPGRPTDAGTDAERTRERTRGGARRSRGREVGPRRTRDGRETDARRTRDGPGTSARPTTPLGEAAERRNELAVHRAKRNARLRPARPCLAPGNTRYAAVLDARQICPLPGCGPGGGVCGSWRYACYVVRRTLCKQPGRGPYDRPFRGPAPAVSQARSPAAAQTVSRTPCRGSLDAWTGLITGRLGWLGLLDDETGATPRLGALRSSRPAAGYGIRPCDARSAAG